MKKSQGPKSHHYVPQMLLKRFANEDGILFYFDKSKPEKGIRRRSPKNLFEETHLYSLTADDGTKDPQIEMDLATEIEGPATHILGRILTAVNSDKTPNLSVAEKKAWNRFFFLQWKRTPEHLKKSLSDFDTEKMLNELLNQFENDYRPMTLEEKEKFQDPLHRNRIIKNAMKEAVARPAPLVTDILDKKQLLFVRLTQDNLSFVIGSNPVLKMCYPGRTHLSDPSVEVWLPISSKVIVSPCAGDVAETLVSDPNPQHIRAINEATFANSIIVAASSEELLESLI